MYDYQLIALLLVLWTQPGDKTLTYGSLRYPTLRFGGACGLRVGAFDLGRKANITL